MSGLPPVGVSVDFYARGMWEVPFWNLGAEAGLRHLHRRRFPCDLELPPDLSTLGAELRYSDTGMRRNRVWTYAVDGRAMVMLCMFDKTAEAVVMADGVAAAAELSKRLEERLRRPAPDDGRVAIAYWCDSSSGPQIRRERVPGPQWASIAGNYATSTREPLEPLMGAGAVGPGRLILWHGAPGTGKTTALRALSRAWRDWCTVHYVCDPEELFGQGAAYLTDVLLAEEKCDDGRERTKLLVLEDSGELMAAEARGQGLARLLNLTDGMLGAGQDLVILLTTNEPLGRLHPAVTRPGRCWAEIEFAELERAEANAWLAARGSEVRVHAATALAELFALERGRAVREPVPFGFAAAI